MEHMSIVTEIAGRYGILFAPPQPTRRSGPIGYVRLIQRRRPRDSPAARPRRGGLLRCAGQIYHKRPIQFTPVAPQLPCDSGNYCLTVPALVSSQFEWFLVIYDHGGEDAVASGAHESATMKAHAG